MTESDIFEFDDVESSDEQVSEDHDGDTGTAHDDEDEDDESADTGPQWGRGSDRSFHRSIEELKAAAPEIGPVDERQSVTRFFAPREFGGVPGLALLQSLFVNGRVSTRDSGINPDASVKAAFIGQVLKFFVLTSVVTGVAVYAMGVPTSVTALLTDRVAGIDVVRPVEFAVITGGVGAFLAGAVTATGMIAGRHDAAVTRNWLQTRNNLYEAGWRDEALWNQDPDNDVYNFSSHVRPIVKVLGSRYASRLTILYALRHLSVLVECKPANVVKNLPNGVSETDLTRKIAVAMTRQYKKDKIKGKVDDFADHRLELYGMRVLRGIARKYPEAVREETQVLTAGIQSRSRPVQEMTMETLFMSAYWARHDANGRNAQLTEEEALEYGDVAADIVGLAADDEDSDVRAVVAEAVQKLATPAGKDVLADLVNDRDDTVRHMATQRLNEYDINTLPEPNLVSNASPSPNPDGNPGPGPNPSSRSSGGGNNPSGSGAGTGTGSGAASNSNSSTEMYSGVNGDISDGDPTVNVPDKQQASSEAKNKSAKTEGGAETDLEFFTGSPSETLDDVVGLEETIEQLETDVIKPFQNPKQYEKHGVSISNGVLLHGPPGTGKSWLAKCLAGEIGASFANVKISEIDSKYVGESIENIEQLFAEARSTEPCIVFLDELDAIAPERGGRNQHQDTDKTVDALLQELSMLKDESENKVLVIAATNHIDGIDDAIRRSGRFDDKIKIGLPDGETRKDLFENMIQENKIPPVDGDRVKQYKDDFIAETRGFTASDINNIVEKLTRRVVDRAAENGIDESHPEYGFTVSDLQDVIQDIQDERADMSDMVEEEPDMSLSDVAGMDALKDTLRNEVIDPIKNPAAYEELEITASHGFLLHGPPGTGKTHITKCLAGELGVNYIEADAANLSSKYTGESASNISDLFTEARQAAPCLVFFDEIDAIAVDRDQDGMHSSKREAVNQLLQGLQSVADTDEDVIVVGATNKKNLIDDAVLRSDRLGKSIKVGLPDRKARIEILKQYLPDEKYDSDDLDAEEIASLTEDATAAAMKNIAEQAKKEAKKRGDSDPGKTIGDVLIRQTDVTTAIDIVL